MLKLNLTGGHSLSAHQLQKMYVSRSNGRVVIEQFQLRDLTATVCNGEEL